MPTKPAQAKAAVNVQLKPLMQLLRLLIHRQDGRKTSW